MGIVSHKKEVQEAFDKQIEKALMIIGMTAERYAVEACPKDTGRLANSITHQVGDKEVTISTNVEYSVYVELGTSKQKPQPYLAPAVVNHLDEYSAITQRVLQE